MPEIDVDVEVWPMADQILTCEVCGMQFAANITSDYPLLEMRARHNEDGSHSFYAFLQEPTDA